MSRAANFMLRYSTVCLLMSIAAANAAIAQPVVVRSARVSPTVFRYSGPDSGRVMLVVEIAGLTSRVWWTGTRSQVAVVDDFGRRYTPISVGVRNAESSNGVPDYLLVPSARKAPQYLFLVEPGMTRFELLSPSSRSIRFIATVASPWSSQKGNAAAAGRKG